ncbi:restriction endonuclease subunit S [Vibrio splendidus]
MVPKGWESTPLKSLLCTPVKNGYSPNAVEQKTGYVVLGLGALTDHTLNTANIKNVEASEQVIKTQLCHGDFLISRSNTPDKVGRSVMFRGEIPNCSYPDLMMKFRANESLVDPYYLEIFLQSAKIRQYFKNCAAGSSSSMVKINKSVVEKTPILKPLLPEQRKIAKILSTWDKAIAITEKLIEASKQQKKSLIQQLLTGKKRLVNPDTGKAFDGEWEEIELSHFFDRVTEKNKGQSTNVVTISAQHGLIRQEEFFKKSVASETLDNYFILRKGQFAYNKSYSNGYPMGAIKRLNRYEDAVVTSLYICFELKNEQFASSCFMEQYFESGLLNRGLTKVAAEGGRAHGLLNVKPSDFMALAITAPQLNEQQKIASVLTAADKEIEALQAKLTHFKQEKKALMQQLLTGKRHVKVDEMEAA